MAARVQVQRATWVRVNVTSTATRGTRLKAYTEDQNYLLYPISEFWVEKDPNFSVKTVWTAASASSAAVTLENLVCPQYRTGLTTINSFITDGEFVDLPPAKKFGGDNNDRRIEFIGDSITAATNVVRPADAPSCGDAGYQRLTLCVSFLILNDIYKISSPSPPTTNKKLNK